MKKKSYLNNRCKLVLLEEQDARRAAVESGMRLEVHEIHEHKRLCSLHVQFRDEETNRVILNYWPGTGKWRAPSGESGTAQEIWDALEIARRG